MVWILLAVVFGFKIVVWVFGCCLGLRLLSGGVFRVWLKIAVSCGVDII